MPNAIETDLPVTRVLPELDAALARGHAVLCAPPGSGKTTLVPLALRESRWLGGQSILMLEPRRIAARAAAHRMAQLLGENIGQRVGYQIRFDRRVSSRTRVEVVTEGILTRRLQNDPGLEGTGLVIFDEFHERSLQADLGLALCLDAVEALRNDLRILVMSATLESGPIASLLNDASVVTGGGQPHEVTRHFLNHRPTAVVDETLAAIRRALREQDGDILAVLPGAGEIRALFRRLGEQCSPDILIRPLYGNLSLDEQVAALTPDPGGRRRVVLATDIAETSLTIEGVTTVVDSGWTREPRFDPNTGLTRLVDRRVSRASARQRCGRAGRLGPGTCYRLWTETQHQGLEAERTPEILASDLAPLALELALWGIADPARLRWIDPPPQAAWTQAVERLEQLDAVDSRGRITAIGRRMANLPVHPRLAHLLVQADALGLARLGADIAALLSERDPIRARAGALRPVDIEQRLHLLESWRDGEGRIHSPDVDDAALRGVDRASRQYRRLLKERNTTGGVLSPGALLALAFPERIAQARDRHSGRYRLANGRGAKLPEGDTLVGTPYLVAAHLDAGQADGRIFLAAPLQVQELRDLFSEHLELAASIRWDDKAGRVTATQRETFGHLVLAHRPIENADPDQVRDALLRGIRSRGIAVLPWTKKARRLQQRLLSVRSWQPEAGWPDLSDQALLDSLEDWLPAWIGGLWRLDQLARLNLVEILLSRLDWPARQRLDTLAPTQLRVPSGSRKTLEYHPGEPPVLAVRLQEMFGLTRTPSVCGGQVAVTLHLLSPAGRPIQVTRDLESFWRNTYPEVKKELKGRYPKHYWPDAPLQAEPTASAKRRR